MDQVDTAPGGDGEAVTVVPASDTTPLSARDAANALTDYQRKSAAKERDITETPAEAPTEAAAPELADEANAAAPQEPPGEQTETPEQVEEPPIEPPRSWTKEEKEDFKALPRKAQEVIARREQDRESTLRKGQNEQAEQRKVMEAERVKLEQAQRQYEATLPALYQALQTAQSGEFADIKTQEDVNKLAAEDWPRFARYQAHLMQVGSLEQEMRKAEDRQKNEFTTKWREFTTKEDALFLDKAPEMADKKRATQVADATVAMFEELGLTKSDLVEQWNSNAYFRSHTNQLLILDAVKFREAKKQVASKIAKPVPQVQKPGTAPPKGQAHALKIANLEKELERTGSMRVAAELLTAQQEARS